MIHSISSNVFAVFSGFSQVEGISKINAWVNAALKVFQAFNPSSAASFKPLLKVTGEAKSVFSGLNSIDQINDLLHPKKAKAQDEIIANWKAESKVLLTAANIIDTVELFSKTWKILDLSLVSTTFSQMSVFSDILPYSPVVLFKNGCLILSECYNTAASIRSIHLAKKQIGDIGFLPNVIEKARQLITKKEFDVNSPNISENTFLGYFYHNINPLNKPHNPLQATEALIYQHDKADREIAQGYFAIAASVSKIALLTLSSLSLIFCWGSVANIGISLLLMSLTSRSMGMVKWVSKQIFAHNPLKKPELIKEGYEISAFLGSIDS